MFRNKITTSNNIGIICLIMGIALVISFLYGFQHLLWLHDLDWDYKNAIFITSFDAWDVEHYLVQIKEIYEGNDRLSNPYIAEYKKSQPSQWPIFPYYLCMVMGKLLRLKVQYLVVLMDFLFPMIIFILAYWFLVCLTSIRLISLLGAFILTTLPHLGRVEIIILTGLRLLTRTVSPIFTEAHQCNGGCFSRTINPQMTYIFLLCSLLFLAKAILSDKKKYLVLSSLFGIALSYSYIYLSLYLYTVLGIIIVMSFIFHERNLLKRAIIILSSVLLASLPFWWNGLQFSHDYLGRITSFEESYALIWASCPGFFHVNYQIIFMLLLCCCFIIGISKKQIDRPIGIIGTALILGGIVCLNQHVITGISLQPNHYMNLVMPQFTILSIFLLVAITIKQNYFRHIGRYMLLMKPTLWIITGIGLFFVSLLFSPAFAASHLSPDGVLTPEVIHGIQIFQHISFYLSLIFILGGMILGILLKFHWNNLIQQQSFSCLYRFYKYGIAFFYILIIGYITYDIMIIRYKEYQVKLKPDLGYLELLYPAFNWLNAHTEKESVIAASFDDIATSALIPIYTSNNVYVAYHAQYYVSLPFAEFRDRIYNMMYLMGIRSQNEFDQFINSELRYWMRINPSICFTEYQQKMQKEIYSGLKKYRVDYLLYGTREKQNFLLNPEETYSFLQNVYDDGVVKIYKIL